MSHQGSNWKDVEEGSDDSVYTIHQVLSFLRGAYRDRDFNKAEKLLLLREERIKDEVVEDVKSLIVEMEKNIEVEGRLRKEVEKELGVKVELEERLRKECEELKEENLRFRDREKQMGKVADVEKIERETVKELKLKIEVEVGLRKKAEEELKVRINKFKELELKVVSLTNEVDMLRNLEAGARGSEMEIEAELQAKVITPRNQFSEGPNSIYPASSVKHGLGDCIEISSSSDDEPFDLQLGSKDKSDLAPVKLDFENDHDLAKVSSGLKRKYMSSANEDKTESSPQPSTSERTLPTLSSQEYAKMQPSCASVSPPPGFGKLKFVNLGQAEATSTASKVSLDDELYKKSILEKLKVHWDDVSTSSDSSSDL